MRDLRTVPVKELTPEQCRKLLVANHGGTLTEERRRAYLFKSANDPERFFTMDEGVAIIGWIQQEAKSKIHFTDVASITLRRLHYTIKAQPIKMSVEYEHKRKAVLKKMALLADELGEMSNCDPCLKD